MPAEETQELGRAAVASVKRWLEATTYIALEWDVYNYVQYCSVEHLGGHKRLDLAGSYLTGTRDLVYVESKRYTTAASARSLYGQFQDFLAVAYSHALFQRTKPHPQIAHWYWVTYHPFELTRWAQLESPGELTAAVTAASYVPDDAVDTTLIHEVASRITVLVYNPKMERFTMTPQEVQRVLGHLERKAVGL
ncbi:hypothetical protein [Isoptericola sp. NPDC019482]|uniref:hypothetical protein n=1 Tax=Isoptericola sp. NPDC019482 TaxID=3154688 RepID=UPI003494B223